MAESVTEVQAIVSAIFEITAAMRVAGVQSAMFNRGPVYSLTLGPEPPRVSDTEPAPAAEPEERLTPEEQERRAMLEHERIQFGSSGG